MSHGKHWNTSLRGFLAAALLAPLFISVSASGSLASSPTPPDAATNGAGLFFNGMEDSPVTYGMSGADVDSGSVTVEWFLCAGDTEYKTTRQDGLPDQPWQADDAELNTRKALLDGELSAKGCVAVTDTSHDVRSLLLQFFDAPGSPKAAYLTYRGNWKIVGNPYEIFFLAQGELLPEVSTTSTLVIDAPDLVATPGSWSDLPYNWRKSSTYWACETRKTAGSTWISSSAVSANGGPANTALSDCTRLGLASLVRDEEEDEVSWVTRSTGVQLVPETTLVEWPLASGTFPRRTPSQPSTVDVLGKHLIWVEMSDPILFWTGSFRLTADGFSASEDQTPPPSTPPMLPQGPVVISGAITPGAVVTCVAPAFDPLATQMEFVWLLGGVEASRVPVASAPFTSVFTVPNTAAAGSTLTCQVLASSPGKTSTVSAQGTVQAVATTPTPTTSPKTCRLTVSNKALAVSFASLSRSLTPSEQRRARMASGSGCRGVFVVTGFVQPTKNKANDISLARARAEALVRTLKTQHPSAKFRIVVAGTTKAKECAAASANRCAVVRSGKVRSS
jgi:hypothetical protein